MFFDTGHRKSMEETCWLCTRPENEHLRKRWGCDEPTQKPRDWVECWRCDEQPATARHLCPTCSGDLRLPIHDCPWKLVGEREAFICQAVAHAEVGILPFDCGGWSELPATTFEAMQLVAKIKGEIDRAEMQAGS